MPRYFGEKVLLVLVFITIGIMVFRNQLLERELIIKPGEPGFELRLDTDAQDGGNTTAVWVDKDTFTWRCNLGTAYDYPFCGMQIWLSDNYLQGRDLSRFTTLDLWLEYKGNAQSFRVFFRNANPKYTKENEIRSTKFNMAELTVPGDHGHYDNIDLSHFRVADWWLQLYPLDMEDSITDFSNVSIIEIQSGTGLKSGEQNFQLRELKLVGLYFSVEQLYFAIIVGWAAILLVYLFARVRSLSQAVSKGKQKEAELSEINALLDARSRKLEEKTKTDPLTGAYNRTGIEDTLKKALLAWKQDQTSFALIMFDVDFFKRINDTRGHAIGDAVLKEISTIVSSHTRREDSFARWGGEEFILVCRNSSQAEAVDTAEKLRKIIAESRYAGDLKISASFGVAVIRENDSIEALFSRADIALYQAKNSGRNQVRFSE